MNTMANTGIIMMVTLMDGFAQTMVEAAGAMASGMAESFGDEEASDQVAEDIERKMPEAKEQMMGMVSELRTAALRADGPEGRRGRTFAFRPDIRQRAGDRRCI